MAMDISQDHEAYLAKLDEAQLAEYKRIQQIVLDVAPNATQSMSYGMPAFKYNGQPLVYVGAFKDHMSLFPTSGPIAALESELRPYQTGKGTLQFTPEKPIPESTIRAILAVRIAQIG